MSKIQAERCYFYGGGDMRKGADNLRSLIGEAEEDVLYLFSNRTRASLKFLSVDSFGVLCGTRRPPTAASIAQRVTEGKPRAYPPTEKPEP